jgi:predicted glycogen debranching enzyme
MTDHLGYRRGDDVSRLTQREWLVTNGMGGYAAGTLSGALTRRFHGLLISALAAPIGRVMMLNHLSEVLVLPGGERIALSLSDHGSARDLAALSEVRLEDGLPVWRFEAGGAVIERRVVLPHQQNTVFVVYRSLAGSGRVELLVRPSVHFRPHEGALDAPPSEYTVKACGKRWEIAGDDRYPPLRLRSQGDAELVLDGGSVHTVRYPVEADRGYDFEGPLYSPGFIRFALDGERSREAVLVASTESW